MAIPNGYRLLTVEDDGKVFGVDLDTTVYIDINSEFGNFNYNSPYQIDITNFLYVQEGTDTNLYITSSSLSSSRFFLGNVYGDWNTFDNPFTMNNGLEITFIDTTWVNECFYVKETATPKEQFVSSMNSLGKSITDKAGASGKKSITELKDLVDNLKTTFTGQEKTVTPSKTSQVITPDSGYDGLSKVTVNVIPSSYIIPSGTLAISENGTKDVTNYKTVNVNIPTPEPIYWDGTYIEEDLESGYTLTLNCISDVAMGDILNDNTFTYSLDSGTTWNQFTSETMVLKNVEHIMFKSTETACYLAVGTTSGGDDIFLDWESDDITITEDTTWYVGAQFSGGGGT